MKQFCRLLSYDIKSGFRESKVKWWIAIALFVFLADVSISNCMVYHEGMGYFGYFTDLFMGMPKYVRSETSIFQLPVSWFLYYAYMFFLVNFYPVTDLYHCGMQSITASGSRIKWLISKFIWTAMNVIAYQILFLMILFLLSAGRGQIETSSEALWTVYGINVGGMDRLTILLIWLIVPAFTGIAISFVQMAIGICINAIAGYLFTIAVMVVSVYWLEPFLIANYLMIIRNNQISMDGVEIGIGFMLNAVCVMLSVIICCLFFRKKDIFQKG